MTRFLFPVLAVFVLLLTLATPVTAQEAVAPQPAVQQAPQAVPPPAAPATPAASPIAQATATAQKGKVVPAIIIKVGPIQSLMNRLYTFLTGKVIDSTNPSATLLAPFADQSAQPYTKGELLSTRLHTNAVPMDQPHRSVSELSEWLMQALPGILSFTADAYQQRLKMMAVGFDANGLAQFDSWVTSSGILATLQKNKMQLNGFVEDRPFLLNQGALDGRYRWLFEVPVDISFIPRGTTSLEHQTGINNHRLIVTLQLGRVENSQLPQGIEIESWSVRENDRKY